MKWAKAFSRALQQEEWILLLCFFSWHNSINLFSDDLTRIQEIDLEENQFLLNGFLEINIMFELLIIIIIRGIFISNYLNHNDQKYTQRC